MLKYFSANTTKSDMKEIRNDNLAMRVMAF